MELRPLTAARFDDLAALFGTTATTRNCHCTWFLLREPRRTEIGQAGKSRECLETFAGSAPAPTGVLAYAGDGTPVGWCAAGSHSWYPPDRGPGVARGRPVGVGGNLPLHPAAGAAPRAQRPPAVSGGRPGPLERRGRGRPESARPSPAWSK